MFCLSQYSVEIALCNIGLRYHDTSPLWGEIHRSPVVLLTLANHAVLWCLLWCVPEETVEQTADILVMWDTMRSMWSHSNDNGTRLLGYHLQIMKRVFTCCPTSQHFWTSVCKCVLTMKISNRIISLKTYIIWLKELTYRSQLFIFIKTNCNGW